MYYLYPLTICHMRSLLFILLLLFLGSAGFRSPFPSSMQEQHVSVDATTLIRRMQGGVGASWHALGKEIPLHDEWYDYPVRMINPRGSGYGGNPPLEDTSAWNQVKREASWLGLDFVRVEISQRMYEPKRDTFDWNNGEMKNLYHILDWCEKNHADVFLQQLWGNVAWNAFPGVHPLLSAPRSLHDFAQGIAALLKELTVNRSYTCIKYFCITNEPPGGTWGYWWSYGSGSGSVTPAWKNVRETLDSAGIHIPLSGPDWTSLPPFDTARIDFDPYIGAYDIHSYGGIDYSGEEIIKNWSDWAHDHHKPFFVSEFGNMNLGWGGSNPGPKSWVASLSDVSDVVRGLNMGADGFNRWSFVNRGDLDGQWQLIRTWDIEKKQYLHHVVPEPEAFYGFAMVTRFMGKQPDLIFWQTNMCIDGVKLIAYRNRDGNIGLLIVNNEKRPIREFVTFNDAVDQRDFNLYQVDKAGVDEPDFQLRPVPLAHKAHQPRTFILAPESITLVTTLHLAPGDPGVIR
jgi:hypothetical protein